MTDKLPSYIEFTPQTDDCAAYYCGNDGVSVLTTYISDDSTRNGDNYAHARDCGNWRGGGEDNARDVSKEDLDALKRMVGDMRHNPELLRMSPLYSEIAGGVASSIKDETMTEASCGAAASYYSNDGVSVLTTYTDDKSFKNGDNHSHARNCGNW